MPAQMSTIGTLYFYPISENTTVDPTTTSGLSIKNIILDEMFDIVGEIQGQREENGLTFDDLVEGATKDAE